MQYLDEADVRCIRSRLATTEMAGRDFGGNAPLSENGFASAVARQQAGYGSHLKYRTVPQIAATLLYGLTLNHAFENGNKRTALVAMLALLQKNRYVLSDVTEDDLYSLCISVASHGIKLPRGSDRTSDAEVEAISRWIEKRSRPLTIGDKRMQFKDLRAQLVSLGCTFSKPANNYIKAQRTTPEGILTVKIGYPRADFNVGVGDVKRIRLSLRLDEIHGVDSAAFYELEETVDTFVNRYRHLLDRLAET